MGYLNLIEHTLLYIKNRARVMFFDAEKLTKRQM